MEEVNAKDNTKFSKKLIAESENTFFRSFRKSPEKTLKTIGFMLLTATFFVLMVLYGFSSKIGGTEGKLVGLAVGTALGSYEGVKNGSAEGAEDGLRAENTTADIKSTMESVGRLEVLAAGVTLKNINEIGDAYKGLYLINGDAVFSVDLNEAQISYSDERTDVYIWLPQPEVDVYLDQSSTQKLAEVQNFSLSVSAEDGLKAYLNSMSAISDEVKNKIANYDALMESAKESAKTQVEQLMESLCGEGQNILVQFS
jgi:hypothetical protein